MLRFLKQYYPIRNIVFYIIEGIVIFASVLLATVLLTFSDSYWFDVMLCLRIVLVTFVCQAALYYNDLYDFQVAVDLPEISIRLLQSLGVTAIVLAFIYFAFPLAIIDQGIFVLSILFLLVFIIGWRFVYIYCVLNNGYFNENIIILGSSDLAIDIFHEIEQKIDCGYSVKAMVPDMNSESLDGTIPGKIISKSAWNNLCQTVLQAGVKKVIVALEESRGGFPTKELLACRTAGIEVMQGNSFYEMLTGKLLVTKITPSWLIFSDGFRKSKIKNYIKRIVDILISFILLVLLSPIFLIVAVLIKIDSRGSVFFSQDRVGQRKQEYMMHKFRSMVQDAEKASGPVWAMQNDNRVTRVGKVIRKFRIDELPQLWDVLKGKMSLVGPRPERRHFTDELEKEIPFYSERFVVKPGITGWAQVSYDYGASIDDAIEKLNYELFYIKNMSLMLDAVIILRTIKTVFFGRGAR